MPDSPLPPVEVPQAERPAAHHPASRPKEPYLRAPVGACDAHVHIVAGPEEFRLWSGRSEDPPQGHGFEDWLSLYRAHLDTLGCTRGVVVQSILYGTDNAVTIEAVRRLGEQFRGVALVTDEVQDDTLDRLAHHRMRAVRLNLVHGGVLSWPSASLPTTCPSPPLAGPGSSPRSTSRTIALRSRPTPSAASGARTGRT